MLVWVLQVPALALDPRLGVVHKAPVILPVAGHADGCQQPGLSLVMGMGSAGCPRSTALTVLTLFDAAALVSDIGVNGVAPRAPLVTVRVAAVILLQPIVEGWQEPVPPQL